MTLLDRLLSALGLGGGSSDDRDAADPTVTIEREPDASDEAAVKGVDAGTTDAADAGTDEASGDEADVVDEEDESEEGAGAAEDEEQAALESEEGAGAAEASESVETVKGIGPAYAEKLGAVGVETVADLAAADADDVAERTSLSATRVGRWIERARERRET